MNPSKTETLFGGRSFTATHEDGSTEQIQVAQIRIGDYERAFAALDDEFALTGLASGKGPELATAAAWSKTLNPENYESLQAAVREVNSNGFFAWSARRTAKLQADQEKIYGSLEKLSPETVKMVLELGMKSLSPTSSRRPS